MGDETHWKCTSCGEEYWIAKGTCVKCGGELVMNDPEKDYDFTGFFQSLTLFHYAALLAAFSLLTILVVAVIGAWYLGFI